jgi:cytochrome P450
MNEIYDRKSTEILQSKGPEDEGLDLMGAMIRGSGQIPGTPNHGKLDAGMTQEEIIGNSFVLFLAGHETAANSIHFSLLYLAMRPDAQRRLQADLDDIFGDRDPSKWDYDTDLPKLFAGWAGAVMNEQLRLIPPVNSIPKSTAPGSPQPLIIDGKEYMVPENCSISLHAVGVHRNPKYWPHGPVRKHGAFNVNSNPDNDLEEFKPERWLAGDKVDANEATEVGKGGLTVQSTDGLAVDTSPDTTSAFKPPKGAYIPFSDGPRACLGRRFAQVEILATLAVIFSKYSVELAVDQWASDDEVEHMDREQRSSLWTKARLEVERKMLNEMGTIITLQLRGEGVKIRIVERGREWFGSGAGVDDL